MTTDTLTKQVSKSAGWSIFMGALTAVIGVLMILYPLATAPLRRYFSEPPSWQSAPRKRSSRSPRIPWGASS